MSWNEASFKEMFLRYYPPLTAFAFRYVKDQDIAKDIVQGVFVRMFEKREALIIHESIKAYIYRAVLNECLNYHKKETTRQLHYEAYVREQHQSLESAIEQTEEEFRIYQAIKTLPTQCQKIFVMSRLENRKNSEIAEQLSLSIRTVETQISNALRILRKALSMFFF
jgi:RNA polymerase sigma-70 factor (family 1)